VLAVTKEEWVFQGNTRMKREDERDRRIFRSSVEEEAEKERVKVGGNRKIPRRTRKRGAEGGGDRVLDGGYLPDWISQRKNKKKGK